MPNKRRTNNKKKNKGKGRHCRQPVSVSNNNRNSLASSSRNNGTTTLQGTVPTHWEKLKQQEQALSEEYPTVYSRYKKATNRFVEYMTKNCPSETGERLNADSLLAAADRMAATGHVIERSVLRDLKLAIRIRSRVAKTVYGGGDAGHKYFLNVLSYCWYVLNSLPKTDDGTTLQEEEEEKQGMNPFAALMEEDEEEENAVEEEEEMFPSNPVPRPSSSGPKPLSLDELLHSDDRSDAIIFLFTLEEIMGAVVTHYKTSVVKNVHFYESIGCPATAIVEQLMEAAVATNMAIQQVQQLEMDLMVQHEHFTTPYRLLATLVYPEITRNIMTIMQDHASVRGCTEKDISIYIGDCMENHFRNRRDPNRKDNIMQEFCQRWQLDSMGIAEIEQLTKGFGLIVSYEVPFASERKQFARIAAEHGLPGSHCWLQNMPSICGDRAIHHTLRILQTFGDIIRDTPENRGIEAKRGFFGRSPWVPGRSHTIMDLDELMMADILPKMVLMCRKGILGATKLPRENEICPFFVTMRKYVEDPGKPVSWGTLFAFHAMSTAILEVDPVYRKIETVSKIAFDNYFDQLDWAQQLGENNPESIGDIRSSAGQTWAVNMMSVYHLKNLGLPVFGDRMLWNPLCAGTTLSYLNYFGNLEAGCATIDCHAQLRITLHLFHALLTTGLLRKGEVPFLDILYNTFRHSKAIWEGQPPGRGEFCYRFLVCFGYSAANARKMAETAKRSMRGMPPTQSNLNDSNRKLVPIEPYEISKSYRRICTRDFHDVVDNYHTPEQRRRNKGTDLYQLMVRTNDTCDAIEDEQQMLSLNFLSCATIIEQFVNSLGRIMQWEPLLADGAAQMNSDQRQGFALLFAQYLLGALDFANDPYGWEFLGVPQGQASSQWMATFYGRANTRQLLWFQATQEEE